SAWLERFPVTEEVAGSSPVGPASFAFKNYHRPGKVEMQNNKAMVFLALVFVALFAYWTLNQLNTYLDRDTNKSFDQLPDTSSTSTENLPEEERPQEPAAMPETPTIWKANNYVEGDIQPDQNYTVISGDTLWELAEGAYGNGTMWLKILNANSNQVGFLPNGQQALIFPGQVLVIP
ncbi:MAG: LysM peptidoglycan-binding domain-containing protein, partial [bacterium]